MQHRKAHVEETVQVLCEALEDRRLLSALPGGIAVIGDSDSDEYAFHGAGRASAANYVELLAQSRGVNFGPYSGSSRGAPRGAGYLYNWARGGDTSSMVLTDGQVAGAAAQVAAHKVSTVIVFIGSNDYLTAIRSANASKALTRATQLVEANIAAILAKLQKANPKVQIVLATVADVGLLPDTTLRRAAGSITATALAQEHQAIATVNADLKRLAAANKNVAIADVAAALHTMVLQPKFKVNGAVVDTRTPGDSPTHLFLADGVHMGTVAQAFLADVFVKAMNKAFGTQVRPFSSMEIRHLADI